jgi:hypothetical protein
MEFFLIHCNKSDPANKVIILGRDITIEKWRRLEQGRLQNFSGKYSNETKRTFERNLLGSFTLFIDSTRRVTNANDEIVEEELLAIEARLRDFEYHASRVVDFARIVPCILFQKLLALRARTRVWNTGREFERG